MEDSDKQSSAMKALIQLTSTQTSLFNIPLSAGGMKIAIFQ
jgi:predicted phage gp36 major capsid-like protein